MNITIKQLSTVDNIKVLNKNEYYFKKIIQVAEARINKLTPEQKLRREFLRRQTYVDYGRIYED